MDSRTNSLIIRDLPLNIEEMVELVRALDTQTPQVLIEAKIVELDVNFERELGIQWGTQFNAGPATGNPTGLNFPNTASVGGVVDNISGQTVPGIANPVVNLPAAVDSSAGGALGFSLASITNSFQLDAQLSALEKRNHARILSSPRVATLSNQEARINQGQEVPYQTTSDEGTKTEFKEAVLALSVTPQITFDRSIIMNILVTNDTPIRDPTVGFIIGTKEARTTVLVKDGDTAVIGGIYTNNDAESLGGVPVPDGYPGGRFPVQEEGGAEQANGADHLHHASDYPESADRGRRVDRGEQTGIASIVVVVRRVKQCTGFFAGTRSREWFCSSACRGFSSVAGILMRPVRTTAGLSSI